MTKMQNAVREADLLLTFGIVRRRAAFDIDRTVLHQRDAVGRGDRHQLGVELGHLQFGLHRIDDLEHQLMRVADDLLLVVVIRKRDRRLAMAQGNDPRIVDLLQRTGQLLGEKRWRREHADSEQSRQCLALDILLHNLLLPLQKTYRLSG